MVYALAVLGLIAAVLVLLLLFGSKRHRRLTPRLPAHPIRQSPATQLQRFRAAGSYRGVKVESHCGASSRFAGREFDFDDAPALPTSGCDAAVCECSYIALPERRRLAERRSGSDRRLSLRLDEDDRRIARPRRKSDTNAWATTSHL